jgi:hypothetical protein
VPLRRASLLFLNKEIMAQIYISKKDKSTILFLEKKVTKKLLERKELKKKHGSDRISDHVDVQLHWNDWIDVLDLLNKLKSKQ